MNKKKILMVLLKSIIIITVFLVIFYLISYLLVGEKKELTNNYASFKNSEGLYLSRISDEFEKYLDEKNISLDIDVPFLDLSAERINDDGLVFSYYEDANNNYLYNLKQAMTKKFGGNFDLLNNITIENSEQDILFTFVNKESLLKGTFDFNKEHTLFGVNESSDSTLTSLININYFKSESNYCVSLMDTNNNEIIFMKDNDFVSYEEAWNYYIENKNSLNKFVYGEDSAIFKVIDINQIGLIPALTNYKNEFIDLQNYFVSVSLKINGIGQIPNDGKNILDQSKIKYNFAEDTILFIVKEGELEPFLAYKY